MKNPDREERKKILSKPYMSREDFYKVLPVGRNQSDQMFSNLFRELQDKGVQLFDTRPAVIPTKYFKERYVEK